MPKAIDSDARNIILKVLAFMREEKRLKAPLIPFKKLNERVAAATGVSEKFVSKLNTGKIQATDEKSAKISTPGINTEKKQGDETTPKKKITRTKGKIVDTFDLGVLRRKIHEYYLVKKEIPSIPKLLIFLREEINFKGSRESLRKLLLKIGFSCRKTKSKRKIPIEPNDTSASKASYLQKIKENNCGEKNPVTFLDNTYIHSSHTVGQCWRSDDIDGPLMIWNSMKRNIAENNVGKPNEMIQLIADALEITTN